MGHDLVEEMARVEPLALQAPLHVGQREQHRVDPVLRDRGAQLVERESRRHAGSERYTAVEAGTRSGSCNVSCQPGSSTTSSSASTTFGSNCVPEQRRISVTASSSGIAAR